MQQSSILRALASTNVTRFMRDYWQRRPLLIRNTLPGFVAPVDKRRLFELARSPDVESRLITKFNRWTVKQGPFARLPSTRRGRWTLLVHGVDLHDDAARALLSRFRFLPDARLDDLMVSYATAGGGVGPHVDSYDVFLLQAYGRRRWRISRQRNLRPKRNASLNIVDGFRASREWVLEPGDMLYLPPGVPHEGIAVGECLTYSIGFRAAAYQQMLEPWFAEYAERAAPAGRYADAGARSTQRPAQLPVKMMRAVHLQLSRHAPRIGDTERFLLRYLTEPKATTVFDAPSKLSMMQFERGAIRRGLVLHRKTRMMYSMHGLAINGEYVEPGAARSELKALADDRHLTPVALARMSPRAQNLLHDWYQAGWIVLAD